MMKPITANMLVVLVLALIAGTGTAFARTSDDSLADRTQQATPPKREFRAAWIQCVNGQWQGMQRDDMQRTLTEQLDRLQRCGVNAIIFQVRPECDALYVSTIEPWSRFLSGKQGRAPTPFWDPLKWMVDECHKRGMELHAWINPYRAKTKGTTELATTHIAQQHPERVFAYDGQLILNPALSVNRQYICDVVKDILRHYDVDGLHIDDYFYPYPVAGITIPDDEYYLARSRGFSDIGQWRRDNVNTFIKQLSDTIHAVKPWVKFGVSPFGIYRNASAGAPEGSNTRGLQNYDDLYADVLLWIRQGWIDYCVPQLYWEIGHKTADYATLIQWWNDHAAARPLFIGEDVERTVKASDPDNPSTNQMPAKFGLHDRMPNVNGTVLWYAKAVVDDIGNYGSLLRTHYWRIPALQPLMPFIDGDPPAKVKKLKVYDYGRGPLLMWQAPKGEGWRDQAARYVVYRFAKGEKVDIGDPSHILAVTADTYYNIGVDATPATYVVTALDRLSNESKPVKTKWKGK